MPTPAALLAKIKTMLYKEQPTLDPRDRKWQGLIDQAAKKEDYEAQFLARDALNEAEEYGGGVRKMIKLVNKIIPDQAGGSDAAIKKLKIYVQEANLAYKGYLTDKERFLDRVNAKTWDDIGWIQSDNPNWETLFRVFKDYFKMDKAS